MYTQLMKVKYIYLSLCVLGLILPYSQLIPLMIEHNGFDFFRFIREIFVNKSSSFIAMDLTITAVTFFVFLLNQKMKKTSYPHYVFLLPLLCVFLVGVSLGFPLFLYLLELQNKKTSLE